MKILHWQITFIGNLIIIFMIFYFLTNLLFYFVRYLRVECEDHDVGVKQDPRVRDMYLNVMGRFLAVITIHNNIYII